MERYQELFHLYVLSGELSKNVSLYYHIGHLFGYSGEELMIILLYSHYYQHNKEASNTKRENGKMRLRVSEWLCPSDTCLLYNKCPIKQL